MLVEREVGDDRLELAVLLAQLPHLPQFADADTGRAWPFQRSKLCSRRQLPRRQPNLCQPSQRGRDSLQVIEQRMLTDDELRTYCRRATRTAG